MVEDLKVTKLSINIVLLIWNKKVEGKEGLDKSKSTFHHAKEVKPVKSK